MHKDIKAIFEEDKVLAEAGEIYGFTKFQFIADAENYVYEIVKDIEPYILKITHTIRRTPEYILGEMEWLHHLAKGGLSAKKADSFIKWQRCRRSAGWKRRSVFSKSL